MTDFRVCSCRWYERRWCGTPGRCDACGGRSDLLRDDEIEELAQSEPVRGSLKLTALVAEVRERRRAP